MKAALEFFELSKGIILQYEMYRCLYWKNEKL